MLPCRGQEFQESDFPQFFLRCLCSPAGGTYFQKSDFSKVLFWGVYALLPGAPIFRHLIVANIFLSCLCSPAGACTFRNMFCKALFEVSLLPCRGTRFQKSFCSNMFLRCLWSPAGGTCFQKSYLLKSFWLAVFYLEAVIFYFWLAVLAGWEAWRFLTNCQTA